LSTFETLAAELIGLNSVEGITPVDILLLPAALRPAMRKMLRNAITVPELAGELRVTEAEARQIAEILVQKGFLQTQEGEDGAGVAYKVRFARMPAHNIPPEL
jgi:hypothetical protein